jgi:hypothetical protein
MAVSARIKYDPSAPIGGIHVANAIRYTILAKQEIARAINIANEMTGVGVTPVNLEGSVEFGVAAGQGAAFNTILTALNNNLIAIPADKLADLDAGG